MVATGRPGLGIISLLPPDARGIEDMTQASRQRILLRNAIVLTLGGGDELLTGTDILIEDGAIAAVGEVQAEKRATCDRVLDLTGRLVVPGFVNGHLHSPAT